MDIKDLNKSQLILLAILLSFITSIATGITTVTLMQQAPSSVTVPINRVVRQTVEKIQQIEGKTTVNTVVVKEEDLVVDAIAENQSATFAISKGGIDENGNSIEIPLGRGFAVSAEGFVVIDGMLARGKEAYFVQNASGKFKADFMYLDNAGFSFLKIGAPLDEKSKLSFTVPTSGDLSEMKIGQKIIVLGSTISSFIFEGNKNIQINVTKSIAGGLVLNLDGKALGIALSGETKSFASIDAINESLKAQTTPKI
ncbi:hypothetical protein A2911_02205 [Candidatus Nomurabacteria bacterium RIFCSPLOWO2_01_FULL_40_15]|uniref:Uncharacterized protein n=1 Tax=Candidatus Nomurabacteria bacterium RIFCSPLOWO2_01_FULL_40_15 TaxID=1801772 RepID=A0A1F6X7U4_9BACT|nr:MAG: hypothetical protein A2911_02205 [Candidatus Nomurabacteria bacterium RIFCSPLOWO2_01_FULL_40_15]